MKKKPSYEARAVAAFIWRVFGEAPVLLTAQEPPARQPAASLIQKRRIQYATYLTQKENRTMEDVDQ